MQDEEPWLGHYGPKDVSDMEMVIMRALGWSPRALTPASFLDQVLWDTLAGPLYPLHLHPGDYLSHARQLAANIVSSNMTGVVAQQLCMPALSELLPVGPFECAWWSWLCVDCLEGAPAAWICPYFAWWEKRMACSLCAAPK